MLIGASLYRFSTLSLITLVKRLVGTTGIDVTMNHWARIAFKRACYIQFLRVLKEQATDEVADMPSLEIEPPSDDAVADSNLLAPPAAAGRRPSRSRSPRPRPCPRPCPRSGSRSQSRSLSPGGANPLTDDDQASSRSTSPDLELSDNGDEDQDAESLYTTNMFF